MSGSCTMQEFKHFRDGATLVISLDGLNWVSKRRCSDKGIKKRDEELQLLMSSGQMIQAVEELQPITCFCIPDQRGSAVPQSWRNSDRKSSLVTRPSSFSVPCRHCCLPVEPTHHSMLTSLASFVSESPEEAPRTRLILNLQDFFTFIKKDLKIVTQKDAVTKNLLDRFIIFCDEERQLQLFGDPCYTEGCRTSIGDTGWHISDNKVLSDLKSSTVHWSHGPDNDNSKHEPVSRVSNFQTCNLKKLLKSFQNYDAAGVLSGRDKNVKKRKSVSFDDDVTVYLFDQESPTLELHSGPCTSLPSSHSRNLPDVTLEDSGLEWEDDFSALEKSFHFQCVRQSVSQHYALSLPTQSYTALSKRSFLPQTCLFLTHVTESDLEL